MHGLVDFHCHLDLYPDHAALIAACEQAQVHTLTVTTTPRAWPENQKLVSGKKYVRAALGLHPQLVAERQAELSLWEEYLPQARYVGEVGLDGGPRYYRSLDRQKVVFEHVLRKSAAAGGKILTVHSVRSATAVLDMIEKFWAADRGAIVLHWFTGTAAEARRAVELGCYFSINAMMLENDRHLKAVQSLPTNRLLTETDGPFTKVSGRTARPSDVGETANKLAIVRGVEANVMVGIIHDNLRCLVTAC